MRKLLLSILLAIACGVTALAQEQRMIYADVTMTEADTVSIDMSSACEAYQNIVLSNKKGKRIRFKSLQKAINHLARYGWKVTVRNEKSVTMELPYSVAVVYGEQGLQDMQNMLKDYNQNK